MVKKTLYSVCFAFLFLTMISSSALAAEKKDSAYQETYQNLLDSFKSYQTTATFPSQSFSYKEVGEVINDVLADHPEIFYFQHKNTLIYSNGKIKISYKYPVSQIKTMVSKQEKLIKSILKETIQPKDSDFDKVKAIHDYIVLNTAYDWTNYQNGTVPDSSYTPYGLMVDGIAVCEGYAKTMQLLLDRAGIENEYIAGTANGGPHAWNMVKVDHHYYYVDATWNDPVPNQDDQVSYKYFLVDAKTLRKDHVWNEKQYPSAASTKYAYFQELQSVQEMGNYFYYSNSKDQDKLYRMKKDGTGKTKLINARAPYFVITHNKIYFSNYSNGGYLYKATLAGKHAKPMNKVHSIDLFIDQNKLYYTNKKTNKQSSIKTN